jgi:adenylosuccinate synthase
MKAEVIVDLQFGSTGKGAVAAFLVNRRKYDASMRVQSIQAGHTVYYRGVPYKMRTIPCAWVNPDVELVLGPGAFIDKDLLLAEAAMIDGAMGGSVRDRLFIDRRANYVVAEDYEVEARVGLEAKVGSTAHGAGASLVRKLMRVFPPTRAMDDTWAADNGFKLCDSIRLYRDAVVLVEGCQGTMLSVHTSPYYPYVTSRECTVAGIVSEAGVAPRDVVEVHGVFRTFPIRVGGNSGSTGGREVSWDEVNERAGRPVEPERTTVTNRVRRVFEFSDEDFEHALLVNKPDRLYMTFADYLGPGVYGKRSMGAMGMEAADAVIKFVDRIERRHSCRVNWIGTGEKAEDFIVLA